MAPMHSQAPRDRRSDDPLTDRPDEGHLRVRFDEVIRDLGPDQALTFGRRADLVLDESNRSLHRELGRIWCADSQWKLANLGTTIALVVTDLTGPSSARLAPGSSFSIPFGRCAVACSAGRANYRITLEQSAAAEVTYRRSTTEPFDATVTASSLVFNVEQHQLLAALARHRSAATLGTHRSPTRRELAAELGWSPSKVGRKLDHLCVKLARAGIGGLVGTTAGAATDRQWRLAELAVELGVVSFPTGE